MEPKMNNDRLEVTITIHRDGQEPRQIGNMDITALADKDADIGEYVCHINENRGGIQRRVGASRVYNWPRKTKGPWDLVGEILARMRAVK
jgi:hypothetical protein